MTIKIDIDNEDSQNNIDDLLDTYIKYLDNDFIELLKKLKETKPETITEEEKEIIYENTSYFGGLYESLNDLFSDIDNEE